MFSATMSDERTSALSYTSTVGLCVLPNGQNHITGSDRISARNTVTLRMKLRGEVNVFRMWTTDLNTFTPLYAYNDATASQRLGSFTTIKTATHFGITLPSNCRTSFCQLFISVFTSAVFMLIFTSGIRRVGLLLGGRTGYQEPGNVPFPRKPERVVAYGWGAV